MTCQPTSQAICTDQCHGCAYLKGAAANEEGHNLLRAAFAALGGYPFFCHESLGWTPDRTTYPEGTHPSLVILCGRDVFIKAGADPKRLEQQTAEIRRSMRACGGWKAAVRRLKEMGWFTRPEMTHVHRHFAKHAAACLERLTTNPEALMPDDQRDRKRDLEDIEEAIRWFFNEAHEAGVQIGWLF